MSKDEFIKKFNEILDEYVKDYHNRDLSNFNIIFHKMEIDNLESYLNNNYNDDEIKDIRKVVNSGNFIFSIFNLLKELSNDVIKAIDFFENNGLDKFLSSFSIDDSDNILIESHNVYENMINDIFRIIIKSVIDYLDNDLVIKEYCYNDRLDKIFYSFPHNMFKFKNISLDTILYVMNNGFLRLACFLPVDVIKELPNSICLEIIKKQTILSLSDEAKQIIISNSGLSFIDVANLIGYGFMWQLYKSFENISEEDFNYIIENKIFDGIEKSKCISNNKEYVKKLIENRYYYILGTMSLELVDDDFLDFLEKTIKSISSYDLIGILKIKWNNKAIDDLRIFRIFSKAIGSETNGFTYLLNNVSEVKRAHVLFCMLDSMEYPNDSRYQRYYSRTLEDILYAIKMGYKCNSNTKVYSLEEIELFIENGQPEIIEYVDEKEFTIDDYIQTIIKSMEHGYSISKSVADKLFTIKNRCELIILSLKNDKIFDFMKYVSGDFFLELYHNEQFKSLLNELKGDMSYYDYFKKRGIFEDILRGLIEYEYSLSFMGEDWTDIVKEDYPEYYQYFYFLEFYRFYGRSLDMKFKDFKLYFDKDGYTENFIMEYLFSDYDVFCKIFNNELMLKINNNPDLLKKYHLTPALYQFILFMNKHNLQRWVRFLDYEKVNRYFDENGCTKEFIEEFILFCKNKYNERACDKIFNEEFMDKIKSNPELVKEYHLTPTILTYLGYYNKYKKDLEHYISSSEDIYKYFNEGGFTKEFIEEIVLFDYNFLSGIFSDDVCNSIESMPSLMNNYYITPSIFQYILFIRNKKFEQVKNIAKNLDDINKYFDENGFTEAFILEYVLFNESLLERIFTFGVLEDMKNDVEVQKEYFLTPELFYYVKFCKKYGLIFKFIIKDKDDIYKYFNKDGATDKLKEFLRDDKSYTDSLLYVLAHNNNVLNHISNELIDIFELYIETYYLYNYDNPKEMYNYFLTNIGPNLLFHLDDDNIKKLFGYSKEQLDKFFGLFLKSKEIPYEKSDKFILSMIALMFNNDCSHIINTYTNINSLLQRFSGNLDDLFEEVNANFKGCDFANLNDVVSFNRFMINDSISLEYKLGYILADIINTLKLDIEGINTLNEAIRENQNGNENNLRDFCSHYMLTKQKMFIAENKDSFFNDSNIGTISLYDKDDLKNKLVDYYLKNIKYEDYKKDIDRDSEIKENEFNIILKYYSKEIITKEAEESVNDFQVKYKLVKDKIVAYVNDIINKKSNKELYKIVDELNLDVNLVPCIILKDIDMISIIANMDFDIFYKSLFGKNGEETEQYRILYKLCRDYYLGQLPDSFGNFFKKNGLKVLGGINNIAKFIYSFVNILKNEQDSLLTRGIDVSYKDIKLSFSRVVSLIDSVNGETPEIKRLIGSSEYLDFIENRSRNEAHYSKVDREKKLVEIIDYLYTLDSATIPSCDILLESSTGKIINFIVGNRTNPANICHGERTGACMRVGGVGEGLFLKCLTDKNWFHIRIEDPETHEYISRVSGFRNGNSVYLNQLRDVPPNPKYTNKDLQEFILIYADNLIKETKDSKFPIENVFINNQYAMKGSNLRSVGSLGPDVKSDYNLDDVLHLRLRNSDDIWTDVTSKALLLATTEEGKQTQKAYADIKNGPDNAIVYPAARDKIYGLEYNDTRSGDERIKDGDKDSKKHLFVEVSLDLLIEKINRVYCMKQKLLGKKYMYEIQPLENVKIKDGYVSSDWYCYVDENNEIHFDYIEDIRKNDTIIPYGQKEEAKKELETYKEVLKNRYSLGDKYGR